MVPAGGAMRAMWMVGLLACGRLDVSGRWEGSCTVETPKGEMTYGLDYALQSEDDVVMGNAVVEPPFLTEPIAGALSGSAEPADDRIDLVAELGDPVQNFTLTHELTYDRAAITLEGPCSVRVQQEEPFDGSATLSRTGDLAEEE